MLKDSGFPLLYRESYLRIRYGSEHVLLVDSNVSPHLYRHDSFGNAFIPRCLITTYDQKARSQK